MVCFILSYVHHQPPCILYVFWKFLVATKNKLALITMYKNTPFQDQKSKILREGHCHSGIEEGPLPTPHMRVPRIRFDYLYCTRPPSCFWAIRALTIWDQLRLQSLIQRSVTAGGTGFDNDGHKPWQPKTYWWIYPTMSWSWQFLKSTPLVFYVFIAVAVMVYLLAVMVCGTHGIGPAGHSVCKVMLTITP